MKRVNGSCTCRLCFKSKTRFQPYVSYDERQIDALNDNASQLGIGANAFSADIILN
jgi:hypothetical protein